jgi:tripartite-type tricarboxylate transporter receptor subunit TctC
MAPPDLPPATLTTLRRAFDAMARDPEFIADAERLQVERDSMSGENLQKMIEAVAQTPPAIIEHAKALLK